MELSAPCAVTVIDAHSRQLKITQKMKPSRAEKAIFRENRMIELVQHDWATDRGRTRDDQHPGKDPTTAVEPEEPQYF